MRLLIRIGMKAVLWSQGAKKFILNTIEYNPDFSLLVVMALEVYKLVCKLLR
jgi:hypothetical protein